MPHPSHHIQNLLRLINHPSLGQAKNQSIIGDQIRLNTLILHLVINLHDLAASIKHTVPFHDDIVDIAIRFKARIFEDGEQAGGFAEVARAADRVNKDGIGDDIRFRARRKEAHLFNEGVDRGDGAGLGEVANEEVEGELVGRGGEIGGEVANKRKSIVEAGGGEKRSNSDVSGGAVRGEVRKEGKEGGEGGTGGDEGAEDGGRGWRRRRGEKRESSGDIRTGKERRWRRG